MQEPFGEYKRHKRDGNVYGKIFEKIFVSRAMIGIVKFGFGKIYIAFASGHADINILNETLFVRAVFFARKQSFDSVASDSGLR